ncbi:hypothetical protein CAI18_05005 [Xanthomonas citri pv. punicae]|nr:hypothetical protein CAI14_16165 [Xanthomonas citri pv. punicae]QCZ69573.1 hypothetical protein CAI17_13800 [Xanthomonas citri pv. punicae]QCZ84551.1 hypothetical protein CAI18_05005 [Xanthomonas citri pv. punicae]
MGAIDGRAAARTRSSHGCAQARAAGLRAAGCGLRAAGCGLRAAGCGAIVHSALVRAHAGY